MLQALVSSASQFLTDVNQSLFRTRDSVPAYTLRGYKLRGILYGFGNIPLESREASLPPLTPGQTTSIPLQFKEKEGATRVEFDVVRPTGFSTATSVWMP